jgi:hypothetical protein
MMLLIKIEDIARATLPGRSGNEGWIGVSPRGDAYHVVSPVDAQLARGVMACNRPTDGTPFGGYSSWIYFKCDSYEDQGEPEQEARNRQIRKNANDLIIWLALYGIEAQIKSSEASEAAFPDCPPSM